MIDHTKAPSFGMFPCPCCGRCVFQDLPGTEEICPVCYWQDDLIGLLDPFIASGPNKVSLYDAQLNFSKFGYSELRFIKFANRLTSSNDFQIDNEWRPINIASDKFFENDFKIENLNKIYYWRSDYWLKTSVAH